MTYRAQLRSLHSLRARYAALLRGHRLAADDAEVVRTALEQIAEWLRELRGQVRSLGSRRRRIAAAAFDRRLTA